MFKQHEIWSGDCR